MKILIWKVYNVKRFDSIVTYFAINFLSTNSKTNVDIKGTVMQTEKLLFLFVRGITQGNWESGVIPSVQDFVFLLLCLVLLKSRKLGKKVSPRFLCFIPPVESFSSDLLRAMIKLLDRVVLRVLSNIQDRVRLRK